MTTFTGYEPKDQIVPDDMSASELSMVSSLEDFLEETVAPSSSHVPGQSGLRGLADQSKAFAAKLISKNTNKHL